mmetsp:Transcript_16201/g.48538  ORF Transcript_16201/g.48538 Transcript_16201/m.48538 type:complete len:82 (+) Transcript_16201:376-621(+)
MSSSFEHSRKSLAFGMAAVTPSAPRDLGAAAMRGLSWAGLLIEEKKEHGQDGSAKDVAMPTVTTNEQLRPVTMTYFSTCLG